MAINIEDMMYLEMPQNGSTICVMIFVLQDEETGRQELFGMSTVKRTS